MSDDKGAKTNIDACAYNSIDNITNTSVKVLKKIMHCWVYVLITFCLE